MQQFGREILGADVALFYYAGHGVQVRGTNYLVPVNANPMREADVDFQMLDVSLVLRQMEGSGTRLNIVILDACRNNPFGGRNLRMIQRGLAQMQAPEGTMISYATQPGNVALDGTDGHSPYTRALAEAVRKPELDIFSTFNEVGLTVKRLTGGEQQPWVSASPIAGKFYFAGKSAVADVRRPGDRLASATLAGPELVPRESHGSFTTQHMQRLMEMASVKGLAIPPFQIENPDSKVPAAFRRFVGAWMSTIGFNNGRGREALLVVTGVDAKGQARGVYAWGPPTKFTPQGNRGPPGFTSVQGPIIGNQVTFKHVRFALTATLNADNSMTLEHKFSGRGAGLTKAEAIWHFAGTE